MLLTPVLVDYLVWDMQDSFLSRLQLKATVYPPNDQIVADDNNRKWWKAFREEMLLYARKERWPVSKGHLPCGHEALCILIILTHT